MGDLAGDCSAETSFARCIVWEADLTFMTVELIAVENPDDKCVLAIKKCSKTKETAYQILSAYFVCREALPLQLKEGSFSTQSGFFSLLFLAILAVLFFVQGKMLFLLLPGQIFR